MVCLYFTAEFRCHIPTLRRISAHPLAAQPRVTPRTGVQNGALAAGICNTNTEYANGLVSSFSTPCVGTNNGTT